MTLPLIERLKLGRDATASVTVNGVELALRVLTEQDHQIAAMAADAMLIKHETELTMSTADAFEAEKALQLITLATLDPEKKTQAFKDADEARSILIRADRDLISEKYLDHERTFSPSGRNLTEAEFEGLLEEVKKNPATPRLIALSGDGLRKLIVSLADQLSISQKASGSSSSGSRSAKQQVKTIKETGKLVEHHGE